MSEELTQIRQILEDNLQAQTDSRLSEITRIRQLISDFTQNTSTIIARVLTDNVTNTSQTYAEIIGLRFEADPNSTYIITGGLNMMYSNGIGCAAGMSIPSGTLSCTFYWKKNTSNDVAMSLINTSGQTTMISASNKEGHVGVYAVVTTGATGGTVKFLHINSGGTVVTKAKSFIKAVKHS